ncbi:MAG: hydroxyglutarate oxidase [Desulfobacteraceae bacterium 4572_35.1]|nr:MAG: hydroxyglutarate oxidase [Desulfobacteraceae bacterium 4572_35.1]
MITCDVVIIGGGIVGAATALALTEQAPGRRVVVVEKESGLACHQTGNNSGVIHSGLYYRPGSLKARNCVEGRKALYRFCAEHDIPHEQCGKVVVATSADEIAALDELEKRGKANGLVGVRRLDAEQLKQYEPHVAGIAGLLVPETGIVDYIKVTQTYAKLVEERGGQVVTDAEVFRVDRLTDGFALTTAKGAIRAKFVVNCAGLHCDRVARMCGVEPRLRIVPFRGEYYKLVADKRGLVKNLIYPVPDPKFPFLGVHYTRMIDGEVEAGPNAVLAFKREGYTQLSFSLRDTMEIFFYPGFLKLACRFWRVGLQEYRRSWCKKTFVRDLRRLLPVLDSKDIYRGGAGVRAQAVADDGSLLDDFQIIEQDGMVHVLNAPSPAATASLSIGKAVAERAVTSFEL